AAGHDTFGVDVDSDYVSALNQGRFCTSEPGVLERLTRARGRFRATTSGAAAVAGTEASFIIVPTPSNRLGGFSARAVKQACVEIGCALKRSPHEQVIAVVSTLLPGSSDRILIPALEGAAGRKVGDGLSYCYNPSFIALGEVVAGIERPDY